MTIFINNVPTVLPSDCLTVGDLLEWKDVKPSGTAVARNGQLVMRDAWTSAMLEPGDRITVISAAFGG